MVRDAKDIPGLAEAKAWEASVRARAFLDLPYKLGGVEVLPLTLHTLAVLEAASNPFLCGGHVTPEVVTQLLWVLAPAFRAGSADGQAEFIAQVLAIGALEDLSVCVREIGEFLDEMFLDAPAPSDGRGANSPSTSQEAVYCEILAAMCGWSVEVTMSTPLPQLYQIVRRLTLRSDPDAKFINRRSDKVRGDWQRAQSAPA